MTPKTKKHNLKFLLTAIFVLAVGFGFLGVEKAQAGECNCGKLEYATGVEAWWDFPDSLNQSASSPEKCFEKCQNEEGFITGAFMFDGKTYGNSGDGSFMSQKSSIAVPLTKNGKQFPNEEPDVCSGVSNFLAHPINCPLLVMLRLFGVLLSATAVLFSWIVDPERMKMIIDNAAIYNTWAMVRDTLNIAFILFLLFSAFATVFQVDKYSYKKILLTLVIMALLVNFSYPITRFIIDLSNMMMYYFLNNLDIGSATFTKFAEHSALSNIINGGNVDSDSTYLLAAVIFVFIFTITLLVIAVLFLIRSIMLAILIIFSSVAFVGAAIPVSELSSNAGKWWTQLFKNAFWGPIMVFMLYVAVTMMDYISTAGMGDMNKIAVDQSAKNPDFLAAISFYMIPLVILWVGLGMAQTMGVVGAKAVTDRGQKFLKSVGKSVGGYNFGKSQWDAYSSARKKRKDEINKGRFMGKVGDKFNKWEDTFIGGIPLVGKSAKKRAEKMRQVEAAKDVREKAADLKGARIEDLSVEVNNSFDATGAIDPKKVNKTSAGSAQAFMDKNADDRKTFVEDAILTKGGTKTPGIAGSGLENVLAGAPANIIQAVNVVIGVAGPPPSSQDALRQVTSYVNRKSEEVVNQYTK